MSSCPACLPTLFCCFLSFTQPCFWDACCLPAFCKLAISHCICCHSNKKGGVQSRGKKFKNPQNLLNQPLVLSVACATLETARELFSIPRDLTGDPNLPTPLQAASSHPSLTEQLGALQRCPQPCPISVAAFAVLLSLPKRLGCLGSRHDGNAGSTQWQHYFTLLFFPAADPSARMVKHWLKLAHVPPPPSLSNHCG